MCGIFFCISKSSQIHNCLTTDELIDLLESRGPDANKVVEIDNVILAGFVLWHQGAEICKQPLESNSHVLLFNGDIFNKDSTTNFQGKSDTNWLLEQISVAETEDDIIKCFKSIEGPFSLIFYNKHQNNLYFARDSLGRNSMLIENSPEHLRLLSTSRIAENGEDDNAMELPPLGIYKLNGQDLENCSIFPWQTPDEEWFKQVNEFKRVCHMNVDVNYTIEPAWLLTGECKERFAFNFYDFPDATFPSTSDLYDFLLNNSEIVSALKEFSSLLENSVCQRVQMTTKFCRSCLENQLPCNHSKVAILFSGGIDCSILAVISDKFVDKSDSIDLINVAFETKSNGGNWNVPDRITAKTSLDNLRRICPERKWNFIEVNVTREELHDCLNKRIKHLIYPLNTVLDESIGCAFWFASRGIGFVDEHNWTSSARVIIVGSGADELFGGYVRHKNAYNRCNGTEAEKQENLFKELENDWRRIPSRNLARDDRVISDSGKTPRAPFIEENLTKFVRSLKTYQRCCFLHGEGIGDKLFLRLYGYQLGLTGSAFLKKRAIQFGSRIANKKQNAADRSAYL